MQNAAMFSSLALCRLLFSLKCVVRAFLKSSSSVSGAVASTTATSPLPASPSTSVASTCTAVAPTTTAGPESFTSGDEGTATALGSSSTSISFVPSSSPSPSPFLANNSRPIDSYVSGVVSSFPASTSSPPWYSSPVSNGSENNAFSNIENFELASLSFNSLTSFTICSFDSFSILPANVWNRSLDEQRIIKSVKSLSHSLAVNSSQSFIISVAAVETDSRNTELERNTWAAPSEMLGFTKTGTRSRR
mmetsp:Transcript_16973/g.46622  ORF Transcript_16973/g.46622 Transcript_16973/m.46622 type:complete len:248 (+) Transcript_16973:1754-2497(+)